MARVANTIAKFKLTAFGFSGLGTASLLLLAMAFGVFALTQPALAQQPQHNPQANSQKKQIQTLAVVNGQQITRNQIATESTRRFGKDVLESIIKKMLVLQQCQKSGINITEKDAVSYTHLTLPTKA